MAIKILTKNAIDNTNIDGARQNHFSAGMRSGIVRGAFNEGKFFATASNIIALDTCELRISGHQVIIDSLEAITLNDRPSTPTKYSMIAEIQVSDMSVPSFRLFIQPASVDLRQENLFKTNNGKGTYQLRIGNFTLGTTGLINDVIRTADIITGGGEGGVSDIKFNATATQLSSSSQPEVNADYNEETKEWDLHFGIPAGSGSKVTIGGVEQVTWSADFVEAERQKSKNLFNGIFTQGAYSFGDGSTVVLDSYIRSKDLIDVKPKENIVLSWVGTTPNDECGFIFYNNGRYVSSTRGTNAVVPANANQVGFNIGQSPTINVDSVSNCQLEYNTIATDYQPYNGAIVHESDLIKITTLWENPNPSINFEEQTITLSSDNYDYGIMVCGERTSELHRQCSFLFTKGTGPLLNYSLTSTSSEYALEVIARSVERRSDTLFEIKNCIYDLNSSAGVVSNNLLIPIKVIGIKLRGVL